MLSDDLSWFLVLAETEHVGDAAAELRIPQPTLSRRLARLEQRMGTTLFDRHGRSLSLNVRGKALRSRIRAAVTQLDLAESEVRRLLDPETGLVRFDFLHSLGTWLAPQLIRAFATSHPRAEIRLHQGTGTELVDRVLDEGSRPKAPERPERSTFLEEWLAKRKQMEAEDKKSAQIPEGSAANDDALDLDLFEDEPVDDDTKGE